MSTLKVTVERVLSVDPHPNADRLEVVTVLGWQVVTRKGSYQAGDLCVYFPVDSVLPPALESWLFPADSKVTLSKGRIKTIKLRGHVSQGMCVPAGEVRAQYSVMHSLEEGDDLTALLGVTKYEPPVKGDSRMPGAGKQRVKRKDNPHFAKYTDLENIKNYPRVLDEQEIVVITEKIHGTNFRAGWVPRVARTWVQRLRQRLNLWWDPWEFVYGSRNVQLQRGDGACYYDTNVYAATCKHYSLEQRLPKGVVIYGEVFGAGIQPGYAYGCTEGETKLRLFDVARNGQYLGYTEARAVADEASLQWSPVLFIGPYTPARVTSCTNGPSVVAPEQAVREGCVVRPWAERTGACGRVLLKSISPDYAMSKHADQEVAHDQAA